MASFADASTRLRRSLPFAAAVWRATDPDSGMMTAPIMVEGLDEDGCAAYWECEVREASPISYGLLARRRVPVASLVASAGGDAARSPLFRAYLRPRGLGDELRGVLRLGRGLWGSVSLFRAEDESAFAAADAGRLEALSGPLARQLRVLAAGSAGVGVGTGIGPGVLVLDSRSQVVLTNPEASERLALVAGAGHASSDHTVPPWALSAAARVRAAPATGESDVHLRLRRRSGGWMVAHASPAGGIGHHADDVILVLDDARPSELASMLLVAYDLTDRECEVTALICRGLDTKEIATALVVSPHTVRDHVKSILAKTRVTSRGELVALIHSERLASAGAETLRLPTRTS